MNVDSSRHRLFAILCADAVGYSSSMAADAVGTVALLDAARGAFAAQVLANGGRVVDTAGDSVLAVFETAVGAVKSAIGVQKELETSAVPASASHALQFRIGINIGDVIEKVDGSVYGSGVNVAARLQSMASAGEITISEAVRFAIQGKIDVAFEDLGALSLKNIPDPVRAYRVAKLTSRESAANLNLNGGPQQLHVVDKPSIAVLAFENIGLNVDQDALVDGICEDIITELSRFHELLVIARNSSFSYKGKSVDVRTIARELDVRYVLEGSIRSIGARIRITAQLIDATSGSHVWAERYDRPLEDLFVIQDEVTREIVRAIAPQVIAIESEKAMRKHPASLKGYELAVRAYAIIWQAFLRGDAARVRDGVNAADEALLVDPRSVLALSAKGLGIWQLLFLGASSNPLRDWNEGLEIADLIIMIDPSASAGYMVKAQLQMNAVAQISAWGQDLIHDAISNLERAYDLNPHSIANIAGLSGVYNFVGRCEKACEFAHLGLRVSPKDPLRFMLHHFLAMGEFGKGDFESSEIFALKGLSEGPGFAHLHVDLAIARIGLKNLAGAKKSFDEAKRIWPAAIERALNGGFDIRDPKLVKKKWAFLRVAAGLEDASTVAEWF